MAGLVGSVCPALTVGMLAMGRASSERGEQMMQIQRARSVGVGEVGEWLKPTVC
jgi:hypothetical protein